MLKKQRANGVTIQHLERPPPLPVPGMSDLHERHSKPVSVARPTSLPLVPSAHAPLVLPKPAPPQVAPKPPPPQKTDAVARFEYPALKTTNGVPPPPPPPPPVTFQSPVVKVAAKSVAAKSVHQPISLAAHHAEIKAAISRTVRIKLPEEEGTDLSEEEGMVRPDLLSYDSILIIFLLFSTVF